MNNHIKSLRLNNNHLWLAGLVVGCGLLVAACSPQNPPQSQEVSSATPTSATHQMVVRDEQDFLNQMIPHHQEAIITSEIIVTKANDSELKKFASDVIAIQTKEVSQMNSWLQDWFNEPYNANTPYQPMMGDLTTLSGAELEKSYIQGMIHHHQGAIEMANQVLTLNPRPEIAKMANDIISVQTGEIATLQGWLANKYGGSDNPATPHQNSH